MFLDDAVADAQTEAGSLADLLGGEEGIENAVGMGDAVAIVAERDFHGIPGPGRRDLDARRAAYGVHGVVGIVEDIEKDLLQLVRVTNDIGQSFIKVLDDFDAMTIEVVGPQLDSAAQDDIELHGITLWWHLPGKTQQILNNLFGALRLLQNDAQVLARTLGQGGI